MASGRLMVAKRSVVKRFFAWLTKALGLKKQYAVIQIGNPLNENTANITNSTSFSQTNVGKEPNQIPMTSDRDYERKLFVLLDKYENGEVVISSLDTKTIEDLSKIYEKRLTFLKGELQTRIKNV